MKAIVVTDQAAGTAGMKLVERPEPQGASLASLSGANYDIAVVRAREAGERRPLRLGPLHQLHPGRSRSLIRHHERLHRPPPCVVKLGQRVPLSNLSRPPKCRSVLSTIAAPVAGLEMPPARTRTLPEPPPISAAADWSFASSLPAIST